MLIFILLVLVGSLFLIPAAILVIVFFAALIDYVRGGGPAATRTASNADSGFDPSTRFDNDPRPL